MFIATQRLMLRSFRDDDAEPLYHLKTASAAHLGRWLGWANKPLSIGREREQISQLKANGFNNVVHAFAILHHEVLIGSIDYTHRNEKLREYEVGYWLGGPYTGQGFMTEALHAVTGRLFKVEKAGRIYLTCHEGNEKSARVARRVGFLHEGLMRNKGLTPGGDLAHMHLFALTPADWPPKMA